MLFRDVGSKIGEFGVCLGRDCAKLFQKYFLYTLENVFFVSILVVYFERKNKIIVEFMAKRWCLCKQLARKTRFFCSTTSKVRKRRLDKAFGLWRL